MRDTSVKIISDRLKEVHLAVAVCGGIGAVEVVKIIRELRRHGALVDAFMTPDALRFVTELSVSWACSRKAITSIGRDAEHLTPYDLAVVVPATLNTIAKCALGICDNAATLMFANHVSSHRPSLFVPAMNVSMASHPRFATYRRELECFGGEFLESPVDEEKLKVPACEAVAAAMVRMWESRCRKG